MGRSGRLARGASGGASTRVAGSRRGNPVPSPAMFERTALPAGPRVISARLPSARSVSIAAYVLAGSRLETAGQIGVAHFMEHLTFKGTTAYPSTRAISEAIEGVGGSFNAATDRESTVYWVRVPRRETERAMDVVGELIVRPRLEAADIQSERAVIIEEIRSYLDDPSEYCQILFQTAMFGDGPLGREICGEESDIAGLPGGGDPRLLAERLPPGQHGRGGGRRPRPRRGDGADDGRLRDRQRRRPRLRPRAEPAGRAAGPDRAPRHQPGPDLPRRARPPSRPSRQLDARRPQRGPRRRHEQPAVPVGARGARAGLRRVVGARRLRRRRRARGLGRGRSGQPAGRARGDPGASWPGSATSSSRRTS